MLHLRWNFSSRARELSDADAVILSIPKSGRTWLRAFISAYFSAVVGRTFAIAITESRSQGVPRIVYSHDWFEHRTKGKFWDRIRGKYLIPPRQLRVPIVLLARDPRDAFVSYFVQLTRRNPATVESFKNTTADALLRDRRRGLGAMVQVMNRWIEEFGNRDDFTIVRYEDLRSDPQEHFARLLTALGISQANREAFNHAASFSSFENMQQLEASGAFGTKILQPRDIEDPESFKVRQGRIGSFREYLSPESQRYATEVCAALHPSFGYQIDFTPEQG